VCVPSGRLLRRFEMKLVSVFHTKICRANWICVLTDNSSEEICASQYGCLTSALECAVPFDTSFRETGFEVVESSAV
jgi:hypothetical protein